MVEYDKSGAVFSDCERFRYDLWRSWGSGPFLKRVTHKRLVFIGLNPSTADAYKNDPTVTRCINFARRYCFGGMHMLNLFGFRSTDPAGCRAMGLAAIGEHNDEHILRVCTADTTGVIVASWGAFEWAQERGEQVAAMLVERGIVVNALALTRQGYPRHPLYLPKDSYPTPWRSPCRRKKPPPPPKRRRKKIRSRS